MSEPDGNGPFCVFNSNLNNLRSEKFLLAFREPKVNLY